MVIKPMMLGKKSTIGTIYSKCLKVFGHSYYYCGDFKNKTKKIAETFPYVYRGTCVMGLCSAIVSLGLLQDLHQSQDNFKYLLTYKLSQDHLELFFSAVRQCGMSS